MRLARPNMSDLFRSLTGRGSVPNDPPEALIEVPPTIVPVTEFCRSLNRTALVAAVPFEESNGVRFSLAVAAGIGAQNVLLATLSPGLWRLFLSLSVSVIGAAPVVPNVIALGVSAPGILEPRFGIPLITRANTQIADSSVEYTLHVPIEGWEIRVSIPDPVTATAQNLAEGSVYACRLL